MKKRIAIVLIGIIVVVLGRGFFYYNGFYSPPPSRIPSYEDIVVPSVPLGEFSDNYTIGEGVILIDLAHRNNFNLEELNVLLLRLVSRGLTIRFLGVEDDLEKELSGEENAEPVDQEEEVSAEEEASAKEKEEEEEEEEEELPDAFIIVSPREEFPKEDKKTIEEFVDNGGKLLLIADPTRYDNMNNISLGFGLIFEPGYLYNQEENEVN